MFQFCSLKKKKKEKKGRKIEVVLWPSQWNPRRKLGQNKTAYSSPVLIFLIKLIVICIESKMWYETDYKASYFMIGDAYKTHDEERQHQSTLFLLSYILYVTKCLCKKYTFCIKEIKMTVVLQGCLWQDWNTCSREENLWPFLENKVGVAQQLPSEENG